MTVGNVATLMSQRNDKQKMTHDNVSDIHHSFMQLGFSLSNWQKVQFNTDLFLDTQKYWRS